MAGFERMFSGESRSMLGSWKTTERMPGEAHAMSHCRADH